MWKERHPVRALGESCKSSKERGFSVEKDKERYDVLRERWRRRKLSEEKKVSKAALDKLGEMEDEDFDVSDPKPRPDLREAKICRNRFYIGQIRLYLRIVSRREPIHPHREEPTSHPGEPRENRPFGQRLRGRNHVRGGLSSKAPSADRREGKATEGEGGSRIQRKSRDRDGEEASGLQGRCHRKQRGKAQGIQRGPLQRLHRQSHRGRIRRKEGTGSLYADFRLQARIRVSRNRERKRL